MIAFHPTKQVRFPRSKRKRIRKKWAKDMRNWSGWVSKYSSKGVACFQVDRGPVSFSFLGEAGKVTIQEPGIYQVKSTAWGGLCKPPGGLK